MTRSASATLAIDGGEKIRESPWPARGLFGVEEKQAADRLFDHCIETGAVIGYHGPEEEAYCQRFAEMHGGGYADAVNSGTAAVYVALRALDLKPFTEVIVPAVSDPGGIMPVPLLNLIPMPADTAPGSFNVGVEQIRQRITERTSAIVIAHIAGIPVDMDPIMQLAREQGIVVVEDCAQAHLAKYKGRLVGTIGDVAAFSTMCGKHHTTGPQGGVVFTRDEKIYQRVRWASDRGKAFGLPGGSTNVIAALNLNCNELATAIGRVQLEKLSDIVAQRQCCARDLAEACSELQSVEIVLGPDDCESTFWFIFARLDLEKLTVPATQFGLAVGAEGITSAPHFNYLPCQNDWFKNRAVFGQSGLPWTSPQYKGDPDQSYPTPNAEAAIACHFVLKLHEKCGDQEIADTAAALRKVEAAYME